MVVAGGSGEHGVKPLTHCWLNLAMFLPACPYTHSTQVWQMAENIYDLQDDSKDKGEP
jgi:hypothetical protein